MPPVHDGFVDLTFSTFNPTAQLPGDSFYGTEIVSRPQFDFAPTADSSIKVSSRARILPPAGQETAPSGIVASMFTYHLNNQNSRDEIDIEILSKPQPEERPGILTNSFDNDPFESAGDVEFVGIEDFDATDFHEYSFVWGTNSIAYLVDGIPYRRETHTIPNVESELRFNTWAPLCCFTRAWDPALLPASSPEENVDVLWRIDHARVETVPSRTADSNFDAIVNELDLLIWESSFGTDALGDANEDGYSDGNDFQNSLGFGSAEEAKACSTIFGPSTMFVVSAEEILFL